MLNSDQRSRLSLLRKMAKCTRKEGIDALEKNNWDTSMAIEWIKFQQAGINISLEEFHRHFEESRKQSAVLPQDRYDVPNTQKVIENRKSRRAKMKQEKKQKKSK